MPTDEAAERAKENARQQHLKNIEVLFNNEALVITVLQALTGGAMFGAISGWERLTELIGERQFLVFLTTVDLALLASVLAAWGKHQYKKWDVKAGASRLEGNQREEEKRSFKSRFYLGAMRWCMAVSVGAFSIALIQVPIFAGIMAIRGE